MPSDPTPLTEEEWVAKDAAWVAGQPGRLSEADFDDGFLAAKAFYSERERALLEALKDCEVLAEKALTEPLSDFAATNVGGIHRAARAALQTDRRTDG